jgi:regulator of replication initiation timing
MKDYEKIRADVSKHFKNEIENLKLEIIRLKNENTDLQVENAILKNIIQKYKNQLESISDSQKSLLGLTAAIKFNLKEVENDRRRSNQDN